MGRNSKLKTKLGPFINNSSNQSRQDAVIYEMNGIQKGNSRYKQNMKGTKGIYNTN